MLGTCFGVLSPIPFFVAYQGGDPLGLVYMGLIALFPIAAIIGGVCGVLASILGYRLAAVRWALLLVAPVLCGLLPFALAALWK